MFVKSASPLASGRLLGALVPPTCPGDPSFLALFAQVGPLSGLSAHFGVVQDLVFFDEEALGLMAPLNMDPKVSAKPPSNQPQPPPLLTPAFIACAYFVPSGRLPGSGIRFFRALSTTCDGFSGDFAPFSTGLQTGCLRGDF